MAQIDQIAVGVDARPVEQRAEFDYDERTMLFKFNALSFIDEKYIQFQWKLDGFDHDWLPPQRQRQVRYTNLSPGSYTFLVRAANRNGPWSEPTRFAFVINPPFWQTWWFIIFSALAVGAAVYSIYRYRVNQLLNIERMRTRIATDLHDDIGASLSRISLFSEVAKEEASKISPRLLEMSQKIGDNARELLDAVGTLVWSIDPRHDHFEDVITHMKNFAQEMFTIRGIEYVMNISPELPSLRMSLEVRKNLLLIFKEAVNNIVRHSECKSAAVRIELRDNQLEMTITDDGKGLPAKYRHDSHGLANMRLRAESMKGKLSIEPVNGKGTRISLLLPIKP
jgi:signal transduction histidine kinase